MHTKRMASLMALFIAVSLVTAIPLTARGQSPVVPTSAQTEELNEAQRLGEQFTQLIQQGKYAQAIPLAQKLLAIAEKAFDPDAPEVAKFLDMLAALYKVQGNYQSAEPLSKRALAIYEKALGPDHPTVANSLNILGLVQEGQGNYQAAEPLLKRALAIYEKALGPDHPTVANSLNNLASLYQAQGNYQAAEPLFKRALAIREKALGPGHPDVATSLNNLATLYYTQGNYAAAEPLSKRALAIYEKASGPDHPDVATTLNTLGLVQEAQGNYQAAELLFKRALAIYEKASGPDHPNVATSLSNLAGLYYTQGNYAAAEPLYKRALTIRKKALGPDHPDVANSLNNLAEMYRAQSNYQEAEPTSKQAIASLKRALGPDHPNVATALNNLALLYQDQGNYPLALNYWQQSLQVEERALSLNLTGGSERQKQLYLQTFSGTKDAVVSFHLQAMLQDPMAARLALTTILQRKGRILDLLSNNQQRLRQNLKPEEQSLFNRLSDARRQLANLTFNRPEKLSPEQYKTQIEQLDAQIQTLEDQLSRRSAEFRAQTQPVTLDAVQRLIPTDTALVEFVVYQPFDPKAPFGKGFGKARYAAYILKPQGDPQGIDLGEAATINQSITAFRDTLQDAQTPVEQLKEAARKVDALVMQPLRTHLGNTHQLLLSPDSALNLIPFEALVDETHHYLVETNAFTYLTSGRDLLRLQTSVPSQHPPLLLGDPYFDQPGVVVAQATSGNSTQPSRSIDLAQQSFPPLPGTEAELTALLPLLNSRYPGIQSLMGKQATKSALEQVQSPAILHLATHGFFESPAPAKDGSTTALATNPLLFSGLLLTGFKLKQSNPTDNGILTALEVTGIDLLGTKLVVLSACNTGAGQLSTGEGVYGLRRAFVIAGAESQLFSLWRIDDGFTPKLMTAYYQKLLAGSGRSEALRQTQLELLHGQEYAHPYYWSSFIPSGNWTPMK